MLAFPSCPFPVTAEPKGEHTKVHTLMEGITRPKLRGPGPCSMGRGWTSGAFVRPPPGFTGIDTGFSHFYNSTRPGSSHCLQSVMLYASEQPLDQLVGFPAGADFLTLILGKEMRWKELWCICAMEY